MEDNSKKNYFSCSLGSGPSGDRKSKAMDKPADEGEKLPDLSSECVELFRAAFTGNLDGFKSLALSLAENEGIGVREAIGKIVDGGEKVSLHFAAAGGGLEVCKYLIEELKLEVDPKNKDGQTPLHHAILSGHFDVVTFLLESGANADALDDEKRTPLHCAAMKGDTKIVTLLLSKGAHLNAANKVGTVLHFAAAEGRLEVCKYLLEELKLDVDSKNEDGQTPLFHAILSGHFDTVTYLLENGANVDASDNQNFIPLHAACRTGDTKIITLLLSKGVPINAANWAGSPLQFAAGCGHRDAVKLLLDQGADPNEGNTYGTLRPLMAATALESWECMELLLQAGADPNAECHGTTPLVHAVMTKNNVDVITRLLEAGADPNSKNNAGLTALETAALDRNYQLVAVLFPVTSRIPTYPDWSIAGLMRHVNSGANMMQIKLQLKEKFHQAKAKGRNAFQEEHYQMAVFWYKEALATWKDAAKDAALLSNISACYARMGDGINALDYASKCVDERPEWPKAHYRLGVALNLQKRYGDAADAFNKGLTLDPTNKELKDVYMKAMEDRLNSMKVEEDNAEQCGEKSI